MSDEMKRELDGIKTVMTQMQRGIADINKRLEDIDKRFDGVDKRVDGIDKRLDGIDKRLDRHDGHLHRLSVEYARMRGDIEDIKQDMATKSDVQRVEANVTRYLEAFAAKLEGFNRQWLIQGDMLMAHHNRFGNHEARLVRLESRPKPA